MEILVFVLPILFSWINYNHAQMYNRNVGMWVFLGFFFGIFSTILLLLLGEKQTKGGNKNE